MNKHYFTKACEKYLSKEENELLTYEQKVKLLDYDNLLKDSIGLRSQNRLNKDQALEVARCNSNHRDIALRF